MRTPFTGVGTALVTPFTKTATLDEAGSAAARAAARSTPGIHFLCPAARPARTRRSPTPSGSASSRSSSTRRAARCRCSPAPAATTRKEVIQLAAEMREGRRLRLLSVTPYYNKPTQEGLYQHFRAIAESTPLPIVLYNVPGRTGVNIDVADARPPRADPEHRRREGSIGQRRRRCATSADAVPSDFLVLSGDDALTLPLMAIGGRGVISVASNEMPAEMVQMVEAAERNDFAAARAIHARHPAAHAGQLRRVEPASGEGRDGGDGSARGDLPPADGVADRRVEGEDV